MPKAAKTAKRSDGNKKVVFTGKRVKGTWSLESKIAGSSRRSAVNEGVMVTENRRVRTLH